MNSGVFLSILSGTPVTMSSGTLFTVNPFSVNNAPTRIRLDLSERAAVEVFIYDLQGKLLRTLTSET
ncbi:MAG: hypothetical protein ONB44_18270 [candidate division KSB1 bacterium]|nr:hypothetical protein [candidate division KSB1 bacterium]MDZ7304075.1 hypothetical protein [candidate division KSB1 bacterium]MDZ7312055.1 hypothetical protein [candidate division KSB1 bacterium]